MQVTMMVPLGNIVTSVTKYIVQSRHTNPSSHRRYRGASPFHPSPRHGLVHLSCFPSRALGKAYNGVRTSTHETAFQESSACT